MERNKTRCRVTANRNTHKHTQLSHLERTLILCLKIPMTSDPCLGTRRHKKGKANACKLWICVHVVQGCIWKCHWKQNGRRARDTSFSYFCARVSVGARVEFMLEAHRHILCRATGRRGWFSMNQNAAPSFQETTWLCLQAVTAVAIKMRWQRLRANLKIELRHE